MKHGCQTGDIALNATLASNSVELLEISNIYANLKLNMAIQISIEYV